MKKPTKPAIETRALPASFKLETRAEGGRVCAGYAAVFRSRTDLGWCDEIISPGAFSAALKRPDDVRGLWNHDSSNVLGRLKSGTLRLAEDERGLKVEIDLPSSAVREAEAIERGDVDQMSFSFIARREEWDETGPKPLRTIHEVELYDVSPVTYPAYLDTSIAMRSLEAHRSAEAEEDDSDEEPVAGEPLEDDAEADDEYAPNRLAALQLVQEMIEAEIGVEA